MDTPRPPAIAVYCGSSPGIHKAYQYAAASLGTAMARAQRPLVYGGGSKGIMGIVSKSCLEAGGHVIGVQPFAMVLAGGEKEKTTHAKGGIDVKTEGEGTIETIVVNSMHERKLEMAKRAGGFVGLPGGYGTFEEVLEVITWTQLGIHTYPVVVVNVLSFYNPLRELIRNSVRDGFILPENEHLVVFVDGPEDPILHETFDWGTTVIEALDGWTRGNWDGFGYDWTARVIGGNMIHGEAMDAV